MTLVAYGLTSVFAFRKTQHHKYLQIHLFTMTGFGRILQPSSGSLTIT